MPEKVSVREGIQIIQVESYGDITTTDLQGSLNAVLKIRQDRGLTRVLVDATKETSFPSIVPVFEFGSELAEAVRGVTFAIATAPEMRHKMEFLETVVLNRGGYVKVFDSVDAALAWLTEKPNKPDADDGK
ncbi:MAG: STAS/SEC14 domain-containing protein [Proteobacteria bacterium]|nr:STAS/SEC14 domain-containing protein [Pseudomonadota bacterium]NOG61505.1 STAS/SEC14 domain-containing protein [Pseudomonadota bacterium]